MRYPTLWKLKKEKSKAEGTESSVKIEM